MDQPSPAQFLTNNLPESTKTSSPRRSSSRRSSKSKSKTNSSPIAAIADSSSSEIPKIDLSSPVYTDYSQIMQSSLEKELFDLNYAPLQKIIIDNSAQKPDSEENSNQQKELFVKAYDLNGNLVYVRITQFGYISDKNNRKTITIGSDAELIPLSVRIGAYECTQKLICGVAFECNNSFCLVKDPEIDDPSPTTINYALIGDEQTDQVLLTSPTNSDLYTVLPVINLEDIRSDPKTILDYTQRIVIMLRKIVWTQLVKDANYFHQKLIKVTETNNDLRRRIGHYQGEISKVLHQMHLENQKWFNSKLESDEIKIKHDMFIRRRKIFINHLQMLFSGMQKINSLITQLEIMEETIDSVSQMYLDNFGC